MTPSNSFPALCSFVTSHRIVITRNMCFIGRLFDPRPHSIPALPLLRNPKSKRFDLITPNTRSTGLPLGEPASQNTPFPRYASSSWLFLPNRRHLGRLGMKLYQTAVAHYCCCCMLNTAAKRCTAVAVC